MFNRPSLITAIFQAGMTFRYRSSDFLPGDSTEDNWLVLQIGHHSEPLEERSYGPFRPAVRLLGPLLQHIFQGVGEDEIVEVNRVDRRTVRTTMDSRLAEVDALGAFGLQLFVQDQSAVEP